MTQVRHLTAAFLAVVLLLCSGPVSARVYQTDDAIIVEGKKVQFSVRFFFVIKGQLWNRCYRLE